MIVRNTCLAAVLAVLLLAPASHSAAAAAEGASVEPFAIDKAHSLLDFTVRLAGFTRVRGTFDQYQGVIMYDAADLTRSHVRVVIRTESVDTGIDFRDKDLKSEKFFDAGKFPSMTFESTRIERTADGFRATGPLTIRGVTREVSIPFAVVSPEAADAWGNRRIAFAGEVSLNRRDYGVIGPDFWNNAISDNVVIHLEISATIPNYERHRFNSREKPSIGEVVLEIAQQQGVQAASERFTALRQAEPDAYNFRPQELLLVARRLSQAGDYDDAVAILELLVASYPQLRESSGNMAALHEEFAKIFLRQGNRAEAARHCQQALELNPETLTAAAMMLYLQ